MKKTKRIVALLLAAVLAVGCLGFAAYAADGADLPTVVFDAQTKEFRFENCGPTGTDLFRDFKNAMPGDNLVQHIRVKVENAGLDTVNHYAYIIGRKDGLVHPEAPITRAEVATIFFRMLTDESREQLWSQSNPYADVAPNMWCNAAVSTMTVGGIVQGYPDGSFRPRANITRAEFAAMAVRFFDVEYDGPDLFSDTTGHWASDLINKAASAGIILGFKDGTFRPDQDITRAEAIAIFNRVLGRAPDKDHLLPDMITWPDNMDTDAWYYANMQEATNSHDYDRVKAADGTEYEVWTKILPVRDWAAFETEWATAGSAKNPGDVYSSQP